MAQQRNNQNRTHFCQICEKEALFQCGQCTTTFYCSRDHQLQDWKQCHKAICQDKKASQNEETQKKILNIRKSYYENFSHKLFAECLFDAKVLVGLEKKRLVLKQTPNNELDYGATICLLAKSYLLLSDKRSAKEELQNYINQKKAFFADISDFPTKNHNSPKHDQKYEFIQKKLNLISCIANLSYSVGIQCITFYTHYTKRIINFFGDNSPEASNCYFLVGCYFAEEGFFNKAIQCYKKSAKIRGPSAGDCFYNMGILYKFQKEYPKALLILQKALKLREGQYGDDSSKVGEVNELLGIIYTELNDFKTALVQYDKAFRIRTNEPGTPQFYNILELIHQLYDKLNIFIDSGQPKMKKTDIYLHLKMNIQNQKVYWQLPQYKKKLESLEDKESSRNKIEVPTKRQEEKDKPASKNFMGYSLELKEDFIATLSTIDLYRLSQLQLQLHKCTSQFSIVFTIGTSPFYQNLTPEEHKELQKHNRKLFSMIKLEELTKLQNTDF